MNHSSSTICWIKICFSYRKMCNWFD